MAQIASNETIDNLEIYAGIAAGAGAIGLAYGVDAASPVYKKNRKSKGGDRELTDENKAKWREHNMRLRDQRNGVDAATARKEDAASVARQQEADRIANHNMDIRDQRNAERVLNERKEAMASIARQQESARVFNHNMDIRDAQNGGRRGNRHVMQAIKSVTKVL